TSPYLSQCWTENPGPTTCKATCPIYGHPFPNDCIYSNSCCNYTNTGPNDCCGGKYYCDTGTINNVWTESTPCDQKISVKNNCDQTASVRTSCTCWVVQDCEIRAYRTYKIDHPIYVFVKVIMLNDDGYFDNFGHPTDKSIEFYVTVNDGVGDVIEDLTIGNPSTDEADAPEPCNYDIFIDTTVTLLDTLFDFMNKYYGCFFEPCTLPADNEYGRCVYYGIQRGSVET
ncbi:hypothetical protein KAU11_06355, partial [Candidatus Babeliales bacterium]|nr:hypothetical protein [Candidatus Babeliales bacterium]